MKKAVYYARVSSSLQEKEGTIESQKSELLKQIKTDGNILVKEYIDNGWSGGRLDRPALDELRRDLKTDTFDAVYFLDSDRIARDVSYQNIIISELLKYKKDIVIKGKSYIHNPENKFNLTVLGAVNEFEKTRIIERFMRGRREKARRGAIVDNANPLGYKHIKKTETSYGSYEINEKEAEVVRLIFNTYANTNSSLTGLVKFLESKGIKSAKGKDHWSNTVIRNILTNTTYYGLHYFNKSEKIESKTGSSQYAKNIKTASRLKEESEWISIPVPPIIDKGLFDEVQFKLKRNAKVSRNGTNKYLLSGLVRCGKCNHIYSGVTWTGEKYYRCNYRDKRYQHSDSSGLKECDNQSIKANQIENVVLNSLEEKILQPSVIKKYVDILRGKKVENKQRLTKYLETIEKEIKEIENKKRRVLDLYAENLLGKEEYVKKINEISAEFEGLTTKHDEITKKISLSQTKKEIVPQLNEYIKLARKNYRKADKDQKMFILRNIIKEMVLTKNEDENRLVIKGFLPIQPQPAGLSPSYCYSNARGGVMWRTKRPLTHI